MVLVILTKMLFWLLFSVTCSRAGEGIEIHQIVLSLKYKNCVMTSNLFQNSKNDVFVDRVKKSALFEEIHISSGKIKSRQIYMQINSENIDILSDILAQYYNIINYI